MEGVSGLSSFARQESEAITPSTLARVACECVQEQSGGMSSYYGRADQRAWPQIEGPRR